MPFLPGRAPFARKLGGVVRGRVASAEVHFRPFGDDGKPYVTYPSIRRTRYDAAERTLRRTPYRRTWALAKSLRAQADTPFEYILLVNNHLQQGFGYSERPEAPAAGRAPLDAFLFDTKEGYCQHFSGAMALLLRMGGVPARVATGFSPGGFSKRRDAWIVRDTDAHAWVEAWFDELGWVTYDPTPDLTPARSQIAALEEPAAAAAAPGVEADPAAGGGSAGGRRLGGVRPDLLLDPQRNNPADAAGAAQDGGIAWWVWLLAAVAVAAAVVALVARLRRRRALGPLSPLDRAVAELEAALRRAGRPVPPGTTLKQLEQRLGTPDATAYLRALSASRYGPAAAAADGGRAPRAPPRARAGPRPRRPAACAVGAAAAAR